MQNSFTIYTKKHLLVGGFFRFAGVIISSVPFQNYIYTFCVTLMPAFASCTNLYGQMLFHIAIQTLEQYCLESADGTDTHCLSLGRNPHEIWETML